MTIKRRALYRNEQYDHLFFLDGHASQNDEYEGFLEEGDFQVVSRKKKGNKFHLKAHRGGRLYYKVHTVRKSQ